MLRIRSLLLPLLAVLLTLSACSLLPSDAPRDEPAPERDNLRVGVGNAIDTAPLRVAVENGMFRQAGLRVDLVEIEGGDEGIDRLASAELDITFASDVALFRAAAAGTSLQLQGEAYTAGENTMALVALPDSGHTSLEDLSWPRVAVDKIGGLGTLTAGSVLETAGFDLDSVGFEEWAMPRMIDALQQGDVDVAWLVEPYITLAEKDFGARVLADCSRGATQDFPMSAYAASGEFAQANPRTLSVFRDVLGRAQQHGADPMVIREALPRFADIDPTTASLVSLGTYPTSLNGVRLQRVADLMHSSGLLADRLDVQSLLPKPELS
ncbi:ABC transporter substrate-binding protein [Qaidamihabitans albus]|uniref:ABC transporter substrate-binding protein n=1 Tax=Qaidamihabitans albus TaxID=2795733 RepID=UPI0018F239E0|nr:ABC transporter substrate-binding protein [Qaidamihabitans albus]